MSWRSSITASVPRIGDSVVGGLDVEEDCPPERQDANARSPASVLTIMTR
ncbi:MAG: hypothetical protein OXU19_01645 [bacterium]|nr:hypothetical protein [bacterium]MDE0241261.1 hypothetical protein [bacterium]MDE0416456.1 hypothetical protein [bacterium]